MIGATGGVSTTPTSAATAVATTEVAAANTGGAGNATGSQGLSSSGTTASGPTDVSANGGLISASDEGGPGTGGGHFGKYVAVFIVLIGLFSMYAMFKKAKGQAA